ncbi:MAG: iron ABC transporter permease [Muribaculaceae bacterium]|nr:iron ABC transporter permease [Muribaculaceae bacterium]
MMKLKIALLGFGCVLMFLINLYFGAVHIPASEVTASLLGRLNPEETTSFIIIRNRLPQALTAFLSGGALSVCGLLLQTSFRNPLAGPSILGISSGASLGVAVVMLFFGGVVSIGDNTFGGSAALISGAIAGSMAVMALLIFFSLRIRSNIMLLIAGMMTGYLTSSVVTLLSSITTAQGIQSYVVWGMGNFGGVSLDRLPLFAVLVGIALVASIMLAKPLNLLLLGDSYARNLGVNVERVRNKLLITSGVLTAVVTAYCGPISFIGIAMPHLARMIFKTDNHFVLMPAVILAGGMATLLCNWGMNAIPDRIIPLNALTPIVGVPVILYVILKGKS